MTLVTQHMARSVDFYEKLGLERICGGRETSFTSFCAGDSFINLSLSGRDIKDLWGRVIFRVDEVDSLHSELMKKGLQPERPTDGTWGERYFHLRDPDGHELSFAQLLS